MRNEILQTGNNIDIGCKRLLESTAICKKTTKQQPNLSLTCLHSNVSVRLDLDNYTSKLKNTFFYISISTPDSKYQSRSL